MPRQAGVTPLLGLLLAGCLLAPGCTFTTVRGAAVAHAVAQAGDEGEAPQELASAGSILPGERLEADLELVGLSAGRFEIEALAPCTLDGRRVLPLRSIAKSTGLLGAVARYHSEAITWIDAESGRPVKKRAAVEQDGSHKRYLTSFEGDAYESRYTRTTHKGERTTTKRWPLPPGAVAHDLVSIIAALRRWDPAPGSKSQGHIVMGTRLWRADLVHLGRQPLPESNGERAALHIEGLARKLSRDLEPSSREPRYLSLWISDDARRVPLEALAQDKGFAIRLELTDYRAGAPHAGEVKPCAP